MNFFHLTELQPDTKRNRQSHSAMCFLIHLFQKETGELDKTLGRICITVEDLNY